MNKFVRNVAEAFRKNGVPGTRWVDPKTIYGLANQKLLKPMKTQYAQGTDLSTIPQGQHDSGVREIRQRDMVRSYLEATGSSHFARLNPPSYDKISTQEFYAKLKALQRYTEGEEVLFQMSSVEVSEIISRLVKLTPEGHQVPDEQRRFPKELFINVPPVPKFNGDPGILEQYIGILTHSAFYYQRTSHTDPIPHILRDLLHPHNQATAPLRTTTMFNDLIYYFGKKSDYASCREYYSQMKLEKKIPNIETYRLLFLNLLKNMQIPKKQLPYKEMLFYFNDMEKFGVPADAKIWAYSYHLLVENVSKRLLLEKMIQHNAPISPDFIVSILRTLDVDCKAILEFAKDYSIPVTPKMLKLCISKLCKEYKFESAWQLLTSLSRSTDVVSTGSVNILINALAEKGRVDLTLLTYNSMKLQLGVTPDLRTHRLMFKAIARNGYHENFQDVYHWTVWNMKRCTSGWFDHDAWSRRCESIIKQKCGNVTTPTEQNMEQIQALLQDGVWDNRGLCKRCWGEYRELRRIFRLLGSIPPAYKRKNA
ncbi:AaceriAGL007Wp [[Ashbya] aceris (nom. inval.)]|nr:AaceriAGL007Wp [[Ashbya] aceris (nom. inval.)]